MALQPFEVHLLGSRIERAEKEKWYNFMAKSKADEQYKNLMGIGDLHLSFTSFKNDFYLI